jgi:hypothetical protein
MELLPEDPQKKKLTIALLAVIGLGAIGVIAYQFVGGEDVPTDPAAAAAKAAADASQPPPEPPKTTGEVGGARIFKGN